MYRTSAVSGGGTHRLTALVIWPLTPHLFRNGARGGGGVSHLNDRRVGRKPDPHGHGQLDQSLGSFLSHDMGGETLDQLHTNGERWRNMVASQLRDRRRWTGMAEGGLIRPGSCFHRIYTVKMTGVGWTHFVHSRRRKTIDPRIPTTPEWSTSNYHRGRMPQPRSAVRCSASGTKGEPHRTKNQC